MATIGSHGGSKSSSNSSSNSRPANAEERDAVFKGALASILQSYAQNQQRYNIPTFTPAQRPQSGIAGLPPQRIGG